MKVCEVGPWLAAAALVAGCGGADFDGGSEASGPGGVGSGGTAPDVAGAGGGGAHVDGGTGGSKPTADPLEITTVTLAAAAYNQDYTQVVATTGGEGAVKFALKAGKLPTGLLLQVDGKIAGRPSGSGTFTFTLVATDSRGTSAEKEMTLIVRRARWLAFTSSDTNPDQSQYHLYVVDRTKAALPRTMLTKDLPPTGSVQKVAFSPDGNWLAFTADQSSDGVFELFLVDMSTDVPGTPVKVDAVNVEAVRWAPGSQRLAFQEATPTGSLVRTLDIVDGKAVVRKSPGNGGLADLAWVNDSLLLFADASGMLSYSRISGTTVGAAQTLSLRFAPEDWVLDAKTERLFVRSSLCGKGGCSHYPALVDFVSGDLLTFPSAPVQADTKLTTFAVQGTDRTWSFFGLSDYPEKPRGAVLGSYTPWGIFGSWSRAGLRFAIRAPKSDADTTSVVIEVDASAEKPVGVAVKDGFSSYWAAGEGLLISGDDGLSYSPWKDGKRQPSIPVTTAFPVGQTPVVNTVVMAPNGEGVLYSAPQQVSSVYRAYWVSLRGQSPTPWRSLSEVAGTDAALGYVSNMNQVIAPDSAAAAVPASASEKPETLWLVDLLDSKSTPKKISPTTYCRSVSASTYCPDIGEVAFQP